MRRFIFSFAALLLFIACAGQQKPPTAEFGFSFITPPGWSVLSQKELNDLFPDTQAFYTVGNKDRSGIITVVTQEIPMDQANAYREALGYFVDQMELSAQKRYYDYKLHEKGQVEWKGQTVWELVYEGSLPTEAQKWRRMITFPSPTKQNYLIFIGFSCPTGQEDRFTDKFSYVERSWEWHK